MTRYPLTWPAGWRRIPGHLRKRAKFSTGETKYCQGLTPGSGSSHTSRKEMTVSTSVERILDSLRRFGISEGGGIISTNVQVRLDGLPRSGQPAPQDPGVAVYWKTRAGKQQVMAIDRYDRVADNLAAIAATLEAMRAIERHGGATILERAFTGFIALPAPTTDWRAIFGVGQNATLDEVHTAYRRLAKERHPDAGGSELAMAELNQAWTAASAVLPG